MKEDSKRQKKLQDKQKTVNKMAIVSPSFSIITLNLNGLKSSIKRYRMAEWIFFKDPNICCLKKLTLFLKTSSG